MQNINNQEVLRKSYAFLPYQLLSKASPSFNSLKEDLLGKLPKKSYRKKIHIANYFNTLFGLHTAERISMSDIDVSSNELIPESYEFFLASVGLLETDALKEHVKIVDRCLSDELDANLVNLYKSYLLNNFDYENDELYDEMPADDFYMQVTLGLFAHIDAFTHHSKYSRFIHPISFGYFFMKKPHPKKWVVNAETGALNLVNTEGNPFTCTSRSFIDFLCTVLYFEQYGEMPDSLYGIRGKLDWSNVDDIDGRLYEFLDGKRERDSKRNWVSLDDLYWLRGYSADYEHPAETQNIWRDSMIRYLKTEDPSYVPRNPFRSEFALWIVYAFFQLIYEAADKNKKPREREECCDYYEYYHLWSSITKHYESKLDDHKKINRIHWPDYIKKQAVPL